MADNITNIDDAMLVAATPQLYEAAGDAFVVFDDARDLMEGWDALADKLGAALDAASVTRPATHPNEEKEN